MLPTFYPLHTHTYTHKNKPPTNPPTGLNQGFLFSSKPLPCLSLAPGDDTLLEFAPCAGGALREERERESDCAVQISLCSAATNQDHLVSRFYTLFSLPLPISSFAFILYFPP